MMLPVETNTLVRNKLGLYDLKIQDENGMTVLFVMNIPFERAVSIIKSREEAEKRKKHE